jgi:RHS repeat-associated protein
VSPDGSYTTGVSDGSYRVLSDVQLSVREVMSATAGVAVERRRYSAYGERQDDPFIADMNGDGFVDFFDYDAHADAFEDGVPAPDDMKADVNADAIVDFFDLDGFAVMFDPDAAGAPAAVRHGYCGYLEDRATGLWLARFRWYDADQGRWIQRDPAGYVDGMGLYEYVGGDPISMFDLMGLSRRDLRAYMTNPEPERECGCPPSQLSGSKDGGGTTVSDVVSDPVLDSIVSLMEWAENQEDPAWIRCMFQCAVLDMTDEEVSSFINTLSSDPEVGGFVTKELAAAGLTSTSSAILRIYALARLSQGKGFLINGVLHGLDKAQEGAARTAIKAAVRSKIPELSKKVFGRVSSKLASRAAGVAGAALLAADVCQFANCLSVCGGDGSYTNEDPILVQFLLWLDPPYDKSKAKTDTGKEAN